MLSLLRDLATTRIPPPSSEREPEAAKAAPSVDEAAIRKSASNFADAYNRGDAKAIAAMYTENGESRDADGETLQGRAEIEKAYAEVFKANPGAKVELLVKSIRFPARDLAVEEGLVRLTPDTKTMPTTTSYVAVHSREGGPWKVALSSEAGVGLDRLDDLEWLVGSWTAKTEFGDVKFTFAKEPKKPVMTASFTRSVAGKEPFTGTIRIAFDPETEKIRSWGFEDDGAHSQALWTNDGKSWLIECRGVTGNGTPFSDVVILQRPVEGAITWRTVDRVLGDDRLPDTKPMRLVRVK